MKRKKKTHIAVRPLGGYHPQTLHQVLCLAGGVAALLAHCIVAELAVLEDTLHLDDSTPSAHEDLGTLTVSVLGNITCHIYIPPDISISR